MNVELSKMELTLNRKEKKKTPQDSEYNVLMCILVPSKLNKNFRFWFTFSLCKKVWHEMTSDHFTHFNK